MTERSQVPLLVIGYQRTDSVVEILDSAISSGVSHVLISIDAPKYRDQSSMNNSLNLRNIVSSYEDKFEVVQIRFLEYNLGCAVHVLNSIDWAFESVEELVVLEDDCIPSKDFFHFVNDGFEIMHLQPEIALICGSQHVPIELCPDAYYKSKYSLTWGWATTKSSWGAFKISMFSTGGDIKLNLFDLDFERIYWQEGCRRAFEGYVDVWDTPLVYYLQTSDKYALLPQQNLITNIGDDSLATHMSGDNTWLFKERGGYERRSTLTAQQNILADNWLSKNFFQIRIRHLFTTRVTRLRDRLSKAPLRELLLRWDM
jgi:hypothetical protein